MELGYLERESERTNLTMRKRLTRGGLTAVYILVALYFLLRNSLDFSDPSSREILIYLGILVVVMTAAIVVGLFRIRGASGNGQNLILPFEENTKGTVAKIIDQEVADGKLQVEEYIDSLTRGKMPHDEKIALTPSYLLLYDEKNKITTIPRSKIYWICVQIKHRDGSYRVRMLVFTEEKIFNMVSVDIEHVKKIADRTYQCIPNVFSDYDTFMLSYELGKLFADNRGEFLRFCGQEREEKRV